MLPHLLLIHPSLDLLLLLSRDLALQALQLLLGHPLVAQVLSTKHAKVIDSLYFELLPIEV